jgi:hypothetical protein
LNKGKNQEETADDMAHGGVHMEDTILDFQSKAEEVHHPSSLVSWVKNGNVEEAAVVAEHLVNEEKVGTSRNS